MKSAVGRGARWAIRGNQHRCLSTKSSSLSGIGRNAPPYPGRHLRAGRALEGNATREIARSTHRSRVKSIGPKAAPNASAFTLRAIPLSGRLLRLARTRPGLRIRQRWRMPFARHASGLHSRDLRALRRARRSGRSRTHRTRRAQRHCGFRWRRGGRISAINGISICSSGSPPCQSRSQAATERE